LIDVCGYEQGNVFLMTDQKTGADYPTHVNGVKRLSLFSQRINAEDTFAFFTFLFMVFQKAKIRFH